MNLQEFAKKSAEGGLEFEVEETSWGGRLFGEMGLCEMVEIDSASGRVRWWGDVEHSAEPSTVGKAPDIETDSLENLLVEIREVSGE